jgi:hypothetical protein
VELPHIDECRHLILKIIEQAIRDYLALENSSIPTDQYYYEIACQFIFDDEYLIDYGGTDKSFRELLDILKIDIDWLRERIIRLKNSRIKEQSTRRDFYVLLYEDDIEEE